jgi:hypothetical protein
MKAQPRCGNTINYQKSQAHADDLTHAVACPLTPEILLQIAHDIEAISTIVETAYDSLLAGTGGLDDVVMDYPQTIGRIENLLHNIQLELITENDAIDKLPPTLEAINKNLGNISENQEIIVNLLQNMWLESGDGHDHKTERKNRKGNRRQKMAKPKLEVEL